MDVIFVLHQLPVHQLLYLLADPVDKAYVLQEEENIAWGCL